MNIELIKWLIIGIMIFSSLLFFSVHIYQLIRISQLTDDRRLK